MYSCVCLTVYAPRSLPTQQVLLDGSHRFAYAVHAVYEGAVIKARGRSISARAYRCMTLVLVFSGELESGLRLYMY